MLQVGDAADLEHLGEERGFACPGNCKGLNSALAALATRHSCVEHRFKLHGVEVL